VHVIGDGRRAAAPRPRITGSSCPQLGIAHGTLCRPWSTRSRTRY